MPTARKRTLPGTAHRDSEVRSLVQEASAHFDAARLGQARTALGKATAIDPVHAAAHHLLARIAQKSKKAKVALDHAMVAFAEETEDASLCDLIARCHCELGNWAAAAAFLRRALTLDPGNGQYAVRLAGAYRKAGSFSLSQKFAQYSARHAPLVGSFGKAPKLRIAGLFGLEASPISLRANSTWTVQEVTNNLTSVLDRSRIELQSFCADGLFHNPARKADLRKADLILNRMTDPETVDTALTRAAALCDELGLPVINHPRDVLLSNRQHNSERFAGRPGILVPRAIRQDGVAGPVRPVVETVIRQNGLRLPVMVRLAGFQGGKHVELVHDPAAHDFKALDGMTAKAPRTLHVIEFHDVAYTDPRAAGLRLIPKYRAFLVNGRVFPVHLFTSTDFNVHLANSKDVHAAHPWLVDLERDFCADPAAHLGADLWQALTATLLDTRLDYVGVDFAPTPDRDRLILFEMNAAMRNWVAELPQGDHVQQAWHAITRAVHEMICDKTGAPRWDFAIPAGLPA